MENQTASFKKSALNYGIVLGIILALITAILYVIDIMTLTKWWLGIIMFFIALVISIVSVAKSKSLLGGFMSFKEAFTSYFITIAVGLLINVIVGILIFVLIDPESAEFLQERIIEISRNMMESFGAPKAEIEKAITKMEGENSYSLFSQLKTYVFQLAFYSVFGLLVALIFRKKDPNE